MLNFSWYLIFCIPILRVSSITKERTEVIFQGTLSPDPKAPEAVWEEYQFKCKPGDVSRRPCLISPYHYRLDWLMWFAAFQVSCRGDSSCHWWMSFILSNNLTAFCLLHLPPPLPQLADSLWNFVFVQTYEQSEWVIHIAGRLLANDTTVLSLLDHNPFQGRDPPR